MRFFLFLVLLGHQVFACALFPAFAVCYVSAFRLDVAFHLQKAMTMSPFFVYFPQINPVAPLSRPIHPSPS